MKAAKMLQSVFQKERGKDKTSLLDRQLSTSSSYNLHNNKNRTKSMKTRAIMIMRQKQTL